MEKHGSVAVLQERRGNRNNLEIIFLIFWSDYIRAPDKRGVLRIIERSFFLFLNENISCNPSLEPSCDGSDDGSQHMF